MSGETKASISGWTTDTLAQHVDALMESQSRFDAERDRRYAEGDALRDQLQALRDRTLALQAKEYERRLEGLNHENARVSSAAEKSVSRELFESRMQQLEDYVAAARGRGAGVQDNRAQIGWVAALIASLIAIGSFVFRGTPEQQTTPPVLYVPAQPGTLVPSPQPPSQQTPR